MGSVCPRCGRHIVMGSRFCAACGFDTMVYAVPPPPKPKNYLVESILVTLLCCLPLGVVGILMALNSDNAYAKGDYITAQINADKAKQFALWGLITYIVLIFLAFAFGIVLAMLDSTAIEEQPPAGSPSFEVTRSLKEIGTELPNVN